MTQYARIENGEVREIVDFDPVGRFHPSLVFVAAPEGVAEGFLYDGVTFKTPPPEPETAPDPDVAGFKLAAYEYLDAAAFAVPLSGYIAPMLDALNARNWTLARQIIGYAAQAQALTPEQYDTLQTLMAAFHIPDAVESAGVDS